VQSTRPKHCKPRLAPVYHQHHCVCWELEFRSVLQSVCRVPAAAVPQSGCVEQHRDVLERPCAAAALAGLISFAALTSDTSSLGKHQLALYDPGRCGLHNSTCSVVWNLAAHNACCTALFNSAASSRCSRPTLSFALAVFVTATATIGV
jgi:hypothetical protein